MPVEYRLEFLPPDDASTPSRAFSGSAAACRGGAARPAPTPTGLRQAAEPQMLAFYWREGDAGDLERLDAVLARDLGLVEFARVQSAVFYRDGRASRADLGRPRPGSEGELGLPVGVDQHRVRDVPDANRSHEGELDRRPPWRRIPLGPPEPHGDRVSPELLDVVLGEADDLDLSALYLSQAAMSSFWMYAYWSHECWRVAAITISCRCLDSAVHFAMLTVSSMRSTGWCRHGVEGGPMMMYFAISANLDCSSPRGRRSPRRR